MSGGLTNETDWGASMKNKTVCVYYIAPQSASLIILSECIFTNFIIYHYGLCLVMAAFPEGLPWQGCKWLDVAILRATVLPISLLLDLTSDILLQT